MIAFKPSQVDITPGISYMKNRFGHNKLNVTIILLNKGIKGKFLKQLKFV